MLDAVANGAHSVVMLSLVLAQLLAASGNGQPVVAPPSLPRIETRDTTNFVFVEPRVRYKGDTLRIDGTICRRANRSVMSAPRAQIEQIAAAGDIVSTNYAYLPRLSQREDQRCGGFGATLKQPSQPVDRVRVCLAQGHAVCRTAH